MAGLFDDKSLKVPPVMGQRARTKLNKHNYFRMPPNMKGVPSAAAGGLGGAVTKGRKMKGYAEGGLVLDENDIPMTPWETDESVRGLQSTPSGVRSAAGMSVPDQMSAMSQGRQRLAETQPETGDNAAINDINDLGIGAGRPSPSPSIYSLQDLQRLQGDRRSAIEQRLAELKNPREGGINLPALQFAAGMLSPTKTGSFGEGMGYGISGGAQALAQQRKDDMEFQKLRTSLGLNADNAALEDAYKLMEIQGQQDYRNEALDLRRRALDQSEANQDYKNAYLKILEGKNGNKAAQKANEYAEKANVKLGEQYQKTADASRELGEGLTQLEQILPDLPESPATDWLTNVDVFNALPMTRAKNEADKIIKQTIIPKVKNLGVNPSNRDLIFTQDAFVKSGSTPRANQRALLAGKLFADRVKEMNDIYNDMYSTDYYAENPRELKRDFNKRIDELPSIAEIVNQKLPPEKSGRNTPISKSGMNQAPSDDLSEIKTKEDYDALPSGTSYIAPDGSRRVKQ